MSAARRLAVVAATAVLVVACGSAASSPVAPSGSPGSLAPGPSLTPVPGGVTPVPGDSSGGGSGGGDSSGGGSSGGGGSFSGGGEPGNPGNPIPVGPGDSGGAMPSFSPTIVTPVAGLANVQPVTAAGLSALQSGPDVRILVTWWSGVEPCSVLAGVDVVRDGSTFTLTIREGSAGQGVACIEIAKYKGAIVDLGELDPGSYSIRATAEPPLTLQVDVRA